MNSQILQIFATIFPLVFVASHAAFPSEKYWTATMNGAPMPATINKQLNPEWVDDWGVQKTGGQKQSIEEACFSNMGVNCEASSVKGLYNPTMNLFFLETDLQLGKQKSFNFVQSSNRANFLPRKIADLIPFTSKNISMILDGLFINPNSPEAKSMRNTVAKCELPSLKGEEKSCTSSLESMIEFSTSKLGGKVEALTSEFDQESKPQKYTIVGRKDMKGDKVVACKKETYPYAIFNCQTANVKAHKVYLMGEDGTKVKAVGLCNHDTSAWNPNHLAFHELNVQPGNVPICHFMPSEHIAWIAKID